MKFLPEDRTNRYLVITVLVSLLLHALVGVALLLSGGLRGPVIANRGEPLFVDIAPDKPKETAPLGNPARPPGPDVPEPEKPRPVAPPAVKSPPSPPARPVPPAPRVAEAPKPAPRAPEPAPRAPEPREVAKPAPPVPPTPKGDEPAYEGRSAQALPQTPKTPPEPQPQPQQSTQQPQAPSPGSEPRVASVPQAASPPGMYRKPGGGGGFQGGQGGVVGQAVPLDTPDPNYREYMQKVRQRIYAKWGYPYEAQARGLHGKLVIEFHIAKDGQLLRAEIIESSGETILDAFALNAVKLAQLYPPLPDAMQRDVLPVVGIFVYSLRSAQSSVFQLLQ